MHITSINTDERLEFRCKNQLIGFVQDSILYGINAEGYAVELVEIPDRQTAITALKEWRVKNNIGDTKMVINRMFKELKEELKR